MRPHYAAGGSAFNANKAGLFNVHQIHREDAIGAASQYCIIQQLLYYAMMNDKDAVTSLAALAHDQRLAIFRLLVREGPSGLPAGDIAEAVGATPTGASFHLKELDRAGLIYATRVGRYIRYAAHFEKVRELLTFLTEDCCRGQPELCGSTIKKARKLCKGGTK